MPSSHRTNDELRLVNEPPRLVRGTGRDLREAWDQRELLRAFVARDLRTRYKGTIFGWAWALARPLVMLLIYGLAVGIFLGAGRTTPQYMIFIYTGLVTWGYFANLVTGSINSVMSNGPLLSKARFPRVLLPLSVAISTSVDLVLQLSVLGVGYWIFSDWPGVSDLLWLPPSLFLVLMSGLAAGFILAAANVYYRDIAFLTDIGLQVGFWLTPVLYSYIHVVRGAQEFGLASEMVTRIYMLNPLANAVIGAQRALWPPYDSPEGSPFAFAGDLGARLFILGIVSAIAAWLSMRMYVRMSGSFAQEF